MCELTVGVESVSKEDLNRTKDNIIDWIRCFVKDSGHENVVIGISGGKDSSVVAALCVQALGRHRVTGVLLPNGKQSDIQYSLDLCKHLSIRHCTVNIGKTVKKLTKEIEKSTGFKLNLQAKTNMPSRARMMALYGVAQSYGKSLVVNTSNLSEDWVGFCTIYGDNTGAFSPLGMLTTDDVKFLGRQLGLPNKFIDKEPSDGLSGKTDEENFGFSYEVLNRYIRTGICKDTVIKEKIDTMHKNSRFKFQTIPMFNYYEEEILAEDIANIYK